MYTDLDLSKSNDGSDEANPRQRGHGQFVEVGAILLKTWQCNLVNTKNVEIPTSFLPS